MFSVAVDSTASIVGPRPGDSERHDQAGQAGARASSDERSQKHTAIALPTTLRRLKAGGYTVVQRRPGAAQTLPEIRASGEGPECSRRWQPYDQQVVQTVAKGLAGSVSVALTMKNALSDLNTRGAVVTSVWRAKARSASSRRCPAINVLDAAADKECMPGTSRCAKITLRACPGLRKKVQLR